jgi:hypothetical protein
MQPFVKADGFDPIARAMTRRDAIKVVRAEPRYAELTDAEVEKVVDDVIADEHDNSTVYVNDTYQVAVRDVPGTASWPDMIWLSIKRRDKEIIHDWRDLQEIKNLIVGPEHEGVELYPAEDRKVDTANQYHIWVLKDTSVWFPFGLGERAVGETSIGTSKQRPFA